MKVLNGKISGGYNFKQFKGQPSSELIISELPEYLFVPIDETDTGAKPLVRTGEKVRAGQIIWQDDSNISSPIHSPVDGVVESVQKKGSQENPINVIRIASRVSGDWENVPGFTSDWRKLGKSDLERVVYLSGTASLGSGGIPTGSGSSVIEPAEVQHIIVHSTDAGVYNPDISLFLKDDGGNHFAEGLSIISKILDQAEIHIAISNNTSTWFQVIDNALRDDLPVKFHRVKSKYPQNHDSVLLKTVLGMDLPSGYKGVNKGVVILGIQDVIQVYEAVVLGKPLIERVVALGGPGLTRRPHIHLKIGTLVSDVVEGRISLGGDQEDLRFIKNSVMSGETLGLDYPIDRNTDLLIALEEKKGQDLMFFARPGIRMESFSNTYLSKVLPTLKNLSTNLQGEHRACLSCGYCQDICPSEILPNILFPYVERDRLDETAIQYGIFKCIDCNLCTYICPSKIPVAFWLKEGKKKLLEDGYVKEDDFIRKYNLIGIKAGRQLVGDQPMQPREGQDNASKK